MSLLWSRDLLSSNQRPPYLCPGHAPRAGQPGEAAVVGGVAAEVGLVPRPAVLHPEDEVCYVAPHVLNSEQSQ